MMIYFPGLRIIFECVVLRSMFSLFGAFLTSLDQGGLDTARGRVDDPASPHYRERFGPAGAPLRSELSPGVVGGPTAAEVMGDEGEERERHDALDQVKWKRRRRVKVTMIKAWVEMDSG